MKNKIATGLVVFSVWGTMISCQDESWMQKEDGGSQLMTIVARMNGDLKTRTCVDTSSPSEVTGILWSPKDSIGVFGDKGTRNALFVATNTGNVAEAEFEGSMTAGEYPLYAYYPYGEENATAEPTALKGNLKLEQSFDLTTGKLEGDYKVGVPVFKTYEGRYEFAFEHLFSLLKFDIDATGTALEGDRLEKIVLTLPESRRLGGAFTFNAESKTVTWSGEAAGTHVLTMTWKDMPALENGQKYTGYLTCAPDIRQGDEVRITVLTSLFKAEFTSQVLMDFQANACYTFPLVLANYKNVVVTRRPVITSFAFRVAENPGKILDRKLVYNNGATRPQECTEEALAVTGSEIKGCIPYLHDFKLVPTFVVEDGLTVTVDGVKQTSGVSEQDFSRPVIYTVSNGEESREYTVQVNNSGLPVVVLTQSGGGSVDWQEAGIRVRAKDADWVETDQMTIYNAEGTVTGVDGALCGIRLRGNSTQNFPKKPFAIKLVEKASVLDMPQHKRWVLLANWMDRTMLRNAVALDIAHRTDAAYPEDGIGWSPRGTSVEVVMDGRHIGNYFLCEQIKIDKNRVNIQDCYEDVLEDNPGRNITSDMCGYLLEFDDNFDEADKFRTQRGLPCMFKDPLLGNTELFSYVQNKVEGVENNLKTGNFEAAYADLDMNSVIDYFFIQELTFNDEYKHPKSVYMYIDGSGKLTAGPVWDFDWQTFVDYGQVTALTQKYGSSYTCRKSGEWLYGASKLAEDGFFPWEGPDYVNDMPYMWYPLLFKDPAFCKAVQTRWLNVYPQLVGVADRIRELAEKNRLSDSFNRAMWPLSPLKNSVGAAFNGDEDLSFDEAVELMVQAYRERLEWMNMNITSGIFVTNAE